MFGFKFSWEGLLKNKWLPYIVLAIAVFTVYAPALHFGFAYFDDNVLILDNFNFISHPANLLEAFRQDVFHVLHSNAFYYRPFMTLSLMLDAFFGGELPGFYYFSNILLHLFSLFLLFIFLRKLNYGKITSFWASLIFAVHPILTQTVAWIPGRNDSLLAVFVLLSFIFFIDYARHWKWESLAWHLIFFLFALFTKETAVFAPLVFALYLFINKKEIFNAGVRGRLNYLLYILIGWLSGLIFWLLLRNQALGETIANTPLNQAIKSVFYNLSAIIVYIGKIIFPFNLSVLPILQDSNFVYGMISVLLIAAFIFLSRKSAKLNNIIFGLAWFLVFLIPSFLQFNQNTAPNFSEHRVYLPFVGFIIILLEIKWGKIGEWLADFLKIDSEKIKIVLLTVLVIILSVMTVVHSRVFDNRVNFWEAAAETSPHSPLAHRNLGAMYWLDGRAGEAEVEYKKALELNPDEPMAHNNLGLVYAQKGDYQKAVNEYQEELNINPDYDNALYNLGLAYWALGKKDDAAQKWQETIAVNPDYLDAYRALIGFYTGNNKTNIVQELLKEFYSHGGK